jgi:hypothetical protein
MRDTNQNRSRQERVGVALLIDGENIPARVTPAALAEAETWGEVMIRRIYGDWASPQMNAWREMVNQYGMRAMHQHLPKKNAADIALTVDAVDLFYQGIRCFCLGSGDSDYVPLVLWLREQGCMVVVISQKNAPLALQRSCSVFVSSEELCPPTQSSVSTREANNSLQTAEGNVPNQHRQPRQRGQKKRSRLPSPTIFSNGEGKP